MRPSLSRLLLAASSLCLSSFVCSPPEPTPLPRASSVNCSSPPRVVLVTLDGVRWQEVFGGTDPSLTSSPPLSPEELLPSLHRLFVSGGAAFGRDSPVLVGGPAHISLPGYLELMRGRPTLDCLTNLCDPELGVTLLDRFPSAAVFSSWDTVRRAATSRGDAVVVDSGRHHRSPAALRLSLPDPRDFPSTVGHFDYRPDRFTMDAVRTYLSAAAPDVLWVSLGDTDEHAHAGDYDAYISALRAADAAVGELVSMYGDDAVFVVTTDHGRGPDWRHHGLDPESARVWVMVRGRGVPPLGHVRLDRDAALADVGATVLRLTSGVPSDRSLI